METPHDTSSLALAEERLHLEREALAIERERLEAIRARLEASSRLARTRHTLPLAAAVALLVLLAFTGGLFAGFALLENRQNRQREARLEQALSRLRSFSGTPAETNLTESARRDVSVFVIQ